MSKYFKSISSFEELKMQYKNLLKKEHPDNGGDVAKMQEINAEYDALFKIWKDRQQKITGETVTETAESTRQEFYTAFGWKGKNYDSNRTLKEIAAIVRAYVKEKYPTYKFSIRTAYASMCQELHVDLKESPIEIYKSFKELTNEEKVSLIKKMEANWLFKLESWNETELQAEFERIWNSNGNFYKCLNEATQAVREDVDAFVKSYNYHDCDGMIDYFDVDFYYFGCIQNNGMDIKVVPKAPRLKENKETTETANKEVIREVISSPEEKYIIEESMHTRTGEKIWLVTIDKTLTRDEYISVNNEMRELGGYYSKYTHSFVFKENPEEKLKAAGKNVQYQEDTQDIERKRQKQR